MTPDEYRQKALEAKAKLACMLAMMPQAAQRETRWCAMSTAYKTRGEELGQLIESKQRQYGDAFGRAGAVFALLYPDGVRPHQMTDALGMLRVVDKLFRIAQRGADGQDLGGESPWKDIAGYGLLGWQRDERTVRDV